MNDPGGSKPSSTGDRRGLFGTGASSSSTRSSSTSPQENQAVTEVDYPKFGIGHNIVKFLGCGFPGYRNYAKKLGMFLAFSNETYHYAPIFVVLGIVFRCQTSRIGNHLARLWYATWVLTRHQRNGLSFCWFTYIKKSRFLYSSVLQGWIFG